MILPPSGTSTTAPATARATASALTPAVLLLAALTLSACAGGKRGSRDETDALRGGLSTMRRGPAAGAPATGWVSLFDGTSLAGWHNFKTPNAPAMGWSAVNGELVRTGEGGDLVTNREYTNFELELDWKVEPGGNSGVIYRIDPTAEVTYQSGPEMQILDDERHADGKNPLTSAGANYALNPAPRGVVKPAGEWNSARLVVNGNHVEHWLNGQQMVTYELGSADWETRRKASKFANSAGYGRAAHGLIALQDHGNRVAFRNIRIRELP